MKEEAQQKKYARGGAGRGQGRKPTGKPKKVPAGVTIESDAKEHLKALSIVSGHSQASIIEWLIKKTKKVPKKI